VLNREFIQVEPGWAEILHRTIYQAANCPEGTSRQGAAAFWLIVRREQSITICWLQVGAALDANNAVFSGFNRAGEAVVIKTELAATTVRKAVA
jgi:hypothetical protein